MFLAIDPISPSGMAEMQEDSLPAQVGNVEEKREERGSG
jgi:hypothetical protein